jgi:hypothetical protein
MSKPKVPLRYWVLWWLLLVAADFVFYVLLTPIWMGLRALAWLAEFRARRRRQAAAACAGSGPRPPGRSSV